MKKPHLITLHPCLADGWENLTRQFGVFRFRNGNQVATIGEQNDLQALWELFLKNTQAISDYDN